MNIGDRVYRAIAFTSDNPWISVHSYFVEHVLPDHVVCRAEFGGENVITEKKSAVFPTPEQAREYGKQELRIALEHIKARYAEALSDAA